MKQVMKPLLRHDNDFSHALKFLWNVFTESVESSSSENNREYLTFFLPTEQYMCNVSEENSGRENTAKWQTVNNQRNLTQEQHIQRPRYLLYVHRQFQGLTDRNNDSVCLPACLTGWLNERMNE